MAKRNLESTKKNNKAEAKVPYDGRVTQVKYLDFRAATHAPTIKSSSTKYDDDLSSFNSLATKGDKVKGLEIKTNKLIFGVLFDTIKDQNGKIIKYIIKRKKVKYEVQPYTMKKIPLQESRNHILDFESFSL